MKPLSEDARRYLDNIRFVARELPKSVGHHHRTTLHEAATGLERILTYEPGDDPTQPFRATP